MVIISSSLSQLELSSLNLQALLYDSVSENCERLWCISLVRMLYSSHKTFHSTGKKNKYVIYTKRE